MPTMEHPMEQPQLPNAASPTKKLHPRKPTDNHLRTCFEITPTEDDLTRIRCKYCNDFEKTVKKFNPTTSRTHLVMYCVGVDPELRRTLMEGTQEFKRLKRLGEVFADQKDDGEGTVLHPSQLQPPQIIVQKSNNAKSKPMEMKEYTHNTIHLEKRTLERHWLDMWKDISREISRLRKEMKEEMDVDYMKELDEDVRGLRKKKAEFARLLGMNCD